MRRSAIQPGGDAVERAVQAELDRPQVPAHRGPGAVREGAEVGPPVAGRVAVIDGGAVIAEGRPAQLKSSVGGEHLEIDLATGADTEAAVVAVKPYATGSIQPSGDGRRLSVPVATAEGLTTRVVRAPDDAGVQVNDVTIQRASLDDVFLPLTGSSSIAVGRHPGGGLPG
jgi:hypothetical protein